MIDYKITSPKTPDYNCIAWAAKDDSRWWEPDPMGDYYWPENISRENTFAAYIEVYKSFGYVICEDEKLEEGYEKIILYYSKNIESIHAARQLRNGKWTSKLGSFVDIEHSFVKEWEVLFDSYGQPFINLSSYGVMRVILKKPIDQI